MVVAGEVSTRICDAVLCGRCTVWSRSGVFGRGLVVGSLRGAAVWCSVIQIAFFLAEKYCYFVSWCVDIQYNKSNGDVLFMDCDLRLEFWWGSNNSQEVLNSMFVYWNDVWWRVCLTVSDRYQLGLWVGRESDIDFLWEKNWFSGGIYHY